MKKICPNCDNNVDERAHFCSICGYDFRQSRQQTEKTDPLVGQKIRHDETVPSLLSVKTMAPGQRILRRYEIINLIGKGGMSIVYKAHDLDLDEVVALKIMKPGMVENKEMVQRFKREIKLGRKIKHPNVCHIYDFGIVDDIVFISMEYLEGKPLSQVIQNKEQLPLEVKLEIMNGVLVAILAAHRENIIHRDLKPSNIMLKPGYVPVIMDFGISRIDREVGITAAGELLGTPTYMSPDQFTGSSPDQRSDIYALGVIFYELFTGMLPFDGNTPIEIAMKHMKVVPPAPVTLNENIPPTINEIIVKCLEKSPENRFQTISDILDLCAPLKGKSTGPLPRVETRKKVLIVDDDDNIRTLIGLALRKNGLDTSFAANGQEAISISLEQKPDIIVTDLMMPQMDGLQMIEFLKDNPAWKKIPLIVMSAKSDRDYIAYCKSLGISEYFVKPFDIIKFVSYIKSILQK